MLIRRGHINWFVLFICIVGLACIVPLHVQAACPSATYVDSYTTLPAAPIFPTTLLSSTLTRVPSASDPLTQNHWSEMANIGKYRPPKPTLSANPTQTNCPHLATGLKNWHNPTTWATTGVPTNGSEVIIPPNTNVLISSCSIDPSFVFGIITIPVGSSLILGDAVINLQAKGFDVKGSLLIGSSTCRLRNKVSITLHGSRNAQALPAPSKVKGIAVTGQVDIHGALYYPTWTRLAMTARPADNIIFVQDIPNWQPGQSIFITTTELKDSRDFNRNEVRTIVSVKKTTLGPNVAAITLNSPLTYTHYGGPEYQAEVGLLNRNILVQGDAIHSAPTDTANAICNDKSVGGYTNSTYPCNDKYLTGFGAHIQVIGAGAIGRFSGLELYRVGQTNILGRYPLHFHMVSNTDETKAFAQDCSVHESYFRCYTIHGTHGVLLSQNTAFNAIGNCFYLSEDGVEENSTIQYNLAAYVHTLGPIQNPSIGINFDFFWNQGLNYYTNNSNLLIPADMTAAGFYITNMYNTFVGNAASGGWAGFSFPQLPAPIGDFKTVNNYSPTNRPFKTPFRGNSAHSAGFWFSNAGAFYFGGDLQYVDAAKTTLRYTSGRSALTILHDTCSDSSIGTAANPAGCWYPSQWKYVQMQDTKAFLTNRGVEHWGIRGEFLNTEVHDAALSLNMLGTFWASGLLMNCRSNHLPTWFAGCPSAPPMSQYPIYNPTACNVRDYYFWWRFMGFQWYDTNMHHILQNAVFRNCRNDWDKCIWGSAPGLCKDTSVFSFITSSDSTVPQIMQISSNITLQNSNNIWQFTSTENTVSARLQNWIDSDGSVTGTGVRTMIGSAMAGGWWNLSSRCTLQLGMFVCPMQPGDSGASFDLHYNAATEAQLGKTICVANVATAPCPFIGNITHFGRAEGSGSLNVAAHAQITGPVVYAAGGWFLRLTNGTPRQISLDNIQVDPTANLLLAIPYPAGTTFNIYYQGANYCNDLYSVCTHQFSATTSVANVVNGFGDLYFWDNTKRILYVRVVERDATLPKPDAPWTSVPPVPISFTRGGLTMNFPSGGPSLIIQATNCATDPCAPQPTVQVPAALYPNLA